jgi:hypothetical protein
MAFAGLEVFDTSPSSRRRKRRRSRKIPIDELVDTEAEHAALLDKLAVPDRRSFTDAYRDARAELQRQYATLNADDPFLFLLFVPWCKAMRVYIAAAIRTGVNSAKTAAAATIPHLDTIAHVMNSIVTMVGLKWLADKAGTAATDKLQAVDEYLRRSPIATLVLLGVFRVLYGLLCTELRRRCVMSAACRQVVNVAPDVPTSTFVDEHYDAVLEVVLQALQQVLLINAPGRIATVKQLLAVVDRLFFGAISGLVWQVTMEAGKDTFFTTVSNFLILEENRADALQWLYFLTERFMRPIKDG